MPRDIRAGEGRSVASMWGDMVAECQRGEVVGVGDRWGNTVAVMVSVEKFYELTGIDLSDDQHLGDAGLSD